MFLKSLKLTNFRNYYSLNIDFDKRPVILIGNNAAGKSSLLEAIYFLSTTKSSRAETDSELIKYEQVFSRVEAVVGTNGDEVSLLLTLENNPETGFKKRVTINGVGRRVVDFLGTLEAVIFSPTDINMVTGSPALRRWHLDLALAQSDKDYKKHLTLYGEFLTSRNRVLKRIKEGLSRTDELDYWTEELVKNGIVVSEKRKLFFEFLNDLKTDLGQFRFDYRQSEISEEKLKQYQGREVAASSTLVGPHRDDFDFVIPGGTKDPDPSLVVQDDLGRNLSHFGSRGEQRIATLAFKLGQLEYMAKISLKRPILLLDDVFSELDVSHRAAVVAIVKNQQTIIATVELENIPRDFLNSARILKVDSGQISE